MDRMEHTVPLGTSENSGRRRRAAMEAPMKELNRKPTTSTDLDHHFQQETHSSSNSPSRRSKRRSHKEHDGMIVNQIQALTLVDDHDDRGYSSLGEEVSEAGAVIVPTRKVLKGSSSSRSLRRNQTSSSHRHRSRRENTNP
jgi:hypothetical protein